ncbi:MAG: SpoIIE family protein phosphatase [Methylococcaceae bacterium]|nr:SpoIIE family protein phosphatase [Methylococcaceae bacterium]
MKPKISEVRSLSSGVREFFRGVVAYVLDQYVTALTLMALIAGVIYVILMMDLKSQEGGTAAVNLSAQQRMLAQRGEFLTLRLISTMDHAERQKIRQSMLEVLTLFETQHAYLRDGDRLIRQGPRLLAEPGELAPELRILFFEPPLNLDREISTYISALKGILAVPIDELRPGNRHANYILSDATDRILQGMDKVVSFHQREADFRLQNTQNLQTVSLAILLIALVSGGSLILRPLVMRLKDSMAGLQTQKDFSDNVVNTAQALIVGVGPSGDIALFNRYAQEITGWMEEEVHGRHFFEHFFPPDDRAAMESIFKDMMQGKRGLESGLETRLLIRSEELVDVVWHNTVILEPETRKPILFLATGDDITERKLAENRLQQTLGELGKLSSRLQGEINLAATLQRSILPSPSVNLPGIQGQATLITSSEVGGDYYDYFQVGGYQSVFLIGDVSGHGVAAGTMVSAAKGGLYPLMSEGVSRPAEILRLLNQTMLATAQQSLLMTMSCLSLDGRTGRVRFANAGHVFPYLRRRGERDWTMLEGSVGLPLGKSVDVDYLAVEQELELEIGDRLFLFTDGVVEEESSLGEPFGYDRLEQLLRDHAAADAETLHRAILGALRNHCGREGFGDDVTLAVIDHTDRVEVQVVGDVSDQLIRISEGLYRGQRDRFTSPISRQLVVFLAEGEFHDLLPRMAEDGIRRVMPRDDAFYHRLGWDNLMGQHRITLDDDLYSLALDRMGERQFQLTHSDEKLFLMEETRAWLDELGILSEDHLDAMLLVMDEMIENSLYGAPRDGQSRPFYEKGVTRALEPREFVRIDLAVGPETVGLMVTDNWGTLTPSVYLDHLTHTLKSGVEAGIGGAGLYLMWRMSDYLQIRVAPNRSTQITTLWDLNKPLSVGLRTGFQFLYHNEFNEVMIHDAV